MTRFNDAVQITVITVTYNSRGTVGRSLDALRPGHESGRLQCVVVDNCSADDTADFVAEAHPWARLVRSPRNVGYGRGCNLGFEHARTPYVLIMNPDVVIEPDAIERLVRFMAGRPKAGMAAPVTRMSYGGYQFAGGRPTPWSMFEMSLGLARYKRRQIPLLPGDPPRRTDWLCGAVMIVRSSLFHELGGFDPRFFLYFEESDLCLRIQRMGYELWAVGEAEAVHAGGASIRSANPEVPAGECLDRFFFPSRYSYLAKHHSPVAAAMAEALDLALAGLRDLGRRLTRRPPKGELRRRLQVSVFVNSRKAV